MRPGHAEYTSSNEDVECGSPSGAGAAAVTTAAWRAHDRRRAASGPARRATPQQGHVAGDRPERTLYQGILQRIRHNKYDVFDARVHVCLAARQTRRPAARLAANAACPDVLGDSNRLEF
jgi:hypothetical protein